MMTGAYALSQDAHVRGDVIYRLLPVKWQASVDLTLYILFLGPGAGALMFYGYFFAEDSWFYKEVSWSSPSRIQIYFFKTLIPIAGGLLIVQGIAECMRCYLAMKNGRWLERLDDVRDTENILVE